MTWRSTPFVRDMGHNGNKGGAVGGELKKRVPRCGPVGPKGIDGMVDCILEEDLQEDDP